MCSHYTALKKQEQMEKYFRVRGIPLPPRYDMWPRYDGVFVRRPPEHDSGDEAVPEFEAIIGRWGLISAMTKTDGLDRAGKLSTFNARSETAAKSYTFGNAWRRAQRCIIPAEAIYEPDWRTGQAVPTRIARTDGHPLGIAGLWDRYRNEAGEVTNSYTMLTINADSHPLFKEFHQPGKEKRMVVILPEGAYGDWLTAPADATRDFLVQFPSERLTAKADPKPEK